MLRAGGVVLLCAGLALSILLARYMRNDLATSAARPVETTRAAIVGHLSSQLKRYGDLVVSTGALVSSLSSQVDYPTSRRIFLDYLVPLDLARQYPGVYGLGFISRVPAADAPALDAATRATGQPGFAISPSPGPYVCPVTYFDWTGRESFPSAYLTVDICSIDAVRDLLSQSELMDQAVVATHASFVGGPNHRYDFAVINPVYRAGAPATTAAERQATLQGWSIGLFQGSVVARGLVPAGSPVLAVRVYTGTSTHPDDLAFVDPPQPPTGAVKTTVVRVGEDGPWTLQVLSNPSAGLAGWLVPLAILLAGLTVTVALFIILEVLIRSEGIAKRQVERATESLRESESLFRSLAMSSPSGIMHTSRHGSCMYANPKMSEITQRSTDALLRFGWFEAIHPDDRQELREALGPVAGKQHELSHNARVLTPEGSVHYASIQASALLGPKSAIEGYVVTVEDVTQQVMTSRHLAHLALHDPLTGLPNRGLFTDRLRQALARARRAGSGVAVLFLDLDRFKVVNDSLGHQAGDELLVLTGERMGSLLRSGETLARIGGDEFAVLMEQVAGLAGPCRVSNRIIARLEDPFVLDSKEAFVSVSIGIVLTTGNEPDPDALLRNADAAMYQAKERGGGRFEVFDAELHGADR